jgi:hypothetical protein
MNDGLKWAARACTRRRKERISKRGGRVGGERVDALLMLMLMQMQMGVMQSTRHEKETTKTLSGTLVHRPQSSGPYPPSARLLFAHYPTLQRQQAPEIAARDDAPAGRVDLDADL